MKRFLFLLLSSLLVLSACGNDEKNEEPKKDTQSKEKVNESKADKDKKKEKVHKEDEKTSNEEHNSQESENQSKDTNIAEQPSNSPLTKEEISQRFKNGQNVDRIVDADGDTWYQAPGNGDVVGYTKPDGTQCTVGGCTTPQEQQNMNNNIDRTPQEQKAHENWVNDQREWVEATEAEKEAIRKREAEKYGYEYNPEDYE